MIADAVTGMVAFSVITLVGPGVFCCTWIHFQAEDAASGAAFGTAQQLLGAWTGVIATLRAAALTIYLAVFAYRIAISLFRAPQPRSPRPSVPARDPHGIRTGLGRH